MKSLLTISILVLLAAAAFGQDYADNQIEIRIDKTHDTRLGETVTVPVTISGDIYELGGFDFLIQYDTLFTSLADVTPGLSLLACGWEYFTYRTAPNMICGSEACPRGLIRVVAIANTNNGAQAPSCYSFADKTVLFKLHFLVTTDRRFECSFAPLRFIWYDCSDNTVMLKNMDDYLLSRYVYDFESGSLFPLDTNYSMDDPYYALTPSYFGAKEACLSEEPPGITYHRGVTFINGGISNDCGPLIDPTGDVNLNGVGYEIADAVLLIKYLVYGDSTLSLNPRAQKQIVDVNRDGNDYSIADFVTMALVINGYIDPPPILPKPGARNAGYELRHGVLEIDSDVAGLLVSVTGEARPTLLADHMEMRFAYDEDRDQTRIVVYNFESDVTMTGRIIDGLTGGIVFAEASTVDGRSIELNKLVPETFVLYQNYPNPFNPGTKIEFAMAEAADYTLTITNTLGQVVDQISGRPASAGVVSIDWDGSGFASGIYVYTLEINGVEQSKKMLLLR